ncbi:MAG TPA: alpha/beta hydrolase [Candidatus Binatia bacterium]|nr:alpha/beta hydrolase [Candidatus Binatia bacterium]
MPFLTHAGVSLRYDRVGAGPAVLLIHGWTFNRTVWERQVLALRDRHTVITVDLRGHGESSHPRTGYTISAMATDLEHLVRALNVPQVVLVGWSMGGIVALDLARRLGERVRGLALVCTTAGGLMAADNDLAVPEKEVEEMKAAMAADFRGFARQFATRLFKRGPESPFHAWAVDQTQKTPPQVALACMDAVFAIDFRPALKTLDVPTAVIHGRHDAVFPPAHGEALKKGIKGATLTILEDSGHTPFLEEPEAFNAALGSLLGGDDAGRERAAAPSKRAGRSAPSAPSGRGRPRTSR